MNGNILLSTLVGAIIGGITNGIAIKMLFRPLNPIKIGDKIMPFTPGVIPKERGRIAKTVGEVVSKELLNEKVLRSWLLKEEVYSGIEESISDFLLKQRDNETTIGASLEAALDKERALYVVCEVEEQLTDRLYKKAVSMELGKVIVERISLSFKEGSLSNLLGPMSFLINETLIETIAAKIEPLINEFVENEGEAMIRSAIEEESQKVLNSEVKEWAEQISDYETIIKQVVVNAYKQLVEKYMTSLLAKLNIGRIVEERILALDLLELETIILSIMKKELNTIIGLGVLLGAMMGLVSALI